MHIINEKTISKPRGKINSLDTSDKQDQADPSEFTNVIHAFEKAYKASNVIVAARIKSFTAHVASKDIWEKKKSVNTTLLDALERAKIYRQAGANRIIIFSKNKDLS